jgi:hypothetical protein
MATVYISPTGNDTTGNGTYALPYLTIQKAIAMTVANDTIILKNGTYTWVTTTFSPRTYAAETNNLAILDAALGNPYCALASGTTNFIGINFINNTQTAIGGIFRSSAFGGTLTFTNCIFRKNTVFSNNNYSSTFLYIGSGTGTIIFANCLFDDLISNVASGICSVIGMETSNSLTMTNCVFYLKQTNGYKFTQLFMANASVFTITMKNCIIVNATGAATVYSQVYTGGSFINNVTYNCTNNITNFPAGTGNITSDPLFVDAPNSNFNLRPTSPCIDTGNLV